MPDEGVRPAVRDNHRVAVVATSRKITPHEAWLHECAKKAFEGSVPALNDFLGKLLTLTTALIGGGFLIVKNEVMGKGFSASALFTMLFSLTITIWGLMPKATLMQSPFTNVADYQKFEKKVSNRKAACIKAACASLLLAILISIVGATGK